MTKKKFLELLSEFEDAVALKTEFSMDPNEDPNWRHRAREFDKAKDNLTRIRAEIRAIVIDGDKEWLNDES